MKAVILAGGSGTRLWPLSREKYSKQFLPLMGDKSLLQETIERVRPVVGDDICVVTTEESRFLVAGQFREMGIDPHGKILCEPAGRNTAPALGLAALGINPEETMLVLPSDHVITNAQKFREAVVRSDAVAAEGCLVTFGISPASPETGFGYIEMGEPLDSFEGFKKVSRFVEKPDLATAKRYLALGSYVWNSGMFAFKAGALLEELARHEPAVHSGLMGLRKYLSPDKSMDQIIPKDLYEAIPRISIDYAVMERSDRVAVLPLENLGWSDLGSFSALYEILNSMGEDNVVKLGKRGVGVSIESKGNLIWGGNKVVAAVGVNDLIIVDTPDALLVSTRDRAQDVKAAVAELAATGREEIALHRKVYRPWGSYTVLERGEGYKVKQVFVNPRTSLSLHLHRRRSEHWVVVEGAAMATKGDETITLSRNESTFLPPATLHKLENPLDEPLTIIEVQNGQYLEEDDIIREDAAQK